MANRSLEAQLRLTAVDRTGKAFKTLQGRLRHIDARAAAFNARQGAFARAQAGIYREMSMLATRWAGPAAIAAGVYYVGNAARKMEDSLVGIQKKTGATAEEMQRLRDEIKDVGREVPVSLEEIAAAFERGGAAGLPLDRLKEFARLSTQVADAWDMSAEDVSNAFAGFNAALDIPMGEKMKTFAGLINELADAGIADESGIVQFIDRVGASLRNFGLTPEEIAAFGSAMLNLKMPAEVAARAMDTLTGKLAAPENLSNKSYNALKDIVGDVQKFSDLIGTDPKQGLLLFFERLEKMTGQERISRLGALMGEGFDDEVSGMVGGLAKVKEALAILNETEKHAVSIAESSTKRVAAFTAQMQLFKNEMDSLADSVGAPLLEKLNDALKWTNETVDRQYDIAAGRRRTMLEGQLESEVVDEFNRRYKAVHGTLDGSHNAYRDALAAVGRGEADSVFAGVDAQARDQKRKAAAEKAIRDHMGDYTAYGEGQRAALAARMAAAPPIPRPSPKSISLREQMASYGRATADVRYSAAVQEFNRNPIEDQMRSGAGMNVLGDLEKRLEQGGDRAAEKISDGGQSAGERLGEAASDKLISSATAAGNALGDAAAVKIRNAIAAGTAAGIRANTGRQASQETDL